MGLLSRFDSWINLLTNIGVRGRDKRTGAFTVRNHLPYAELLELYRADRYAARIVDKPAGEMFREWGCVRVADDVDLGKQMDDRLKELKARHFLKDAYKKMRMSGGGLVYMAINDGAATLEEPVNEDNIKSIDFLVNFSIMEVWAADYYADPFEENFRLPKVYNVTPRILHDSTEAPPVRGLVRVHESRFLRFSGPQLDEYFFTQNRGFGDSPLQLCWELVRDYGQTWSSFFALLQGYAQDIYKLNGLKEAIASDQGSVETRLQLMQAQRSVLRGVFLDNGDTGMQPETFETKAVPLTGLDKMVEKMSLELAATAEMPVSLLMGQAPSGLNATGEADIQFWYDLIADKQNDDLRPQIERLVRYLFKEKKGIAKGKEPEKWTWNFEKLTQLNDKDEAQRRLWQSQADTGYITAGVLSPDEVAQSRFGGPEYSGDTQLDGEARQTMKEIRDQDLAQQDQQGEKHDLTVQGMQQKLELAQTPQPGNYLDPVKDPGVPKGSKQTDQTPGKPIKDK